MRFLFYSHDSYGLGHVRRTTLIAEHLGDRLPGTSSLVLTGSPQAHHFPYPAGCDYLKLPSLSKGPGGRYVTRDLDLSLGETITLRRQLILVAARAFQPQIFYADHTPTGPEGEIRAALQEMSASPVCPQRLLGMRDVIDEPGRVRAAWRRGRIVEFLRRNYDRILVYGQPDLFDPIREYGIPDDVAAKLSFVGYLGGRDGHSRPEAIRARFAPRTGTLVVVTAGGGGDGKQLMRTFLKGFEQLGSRPPLEAVLVTGPLMSPRKRRRLVECARRLEGVRVLECLTDLPGLYRAADFVVSMAGYNTVCELAWARVRSLLVPRTTPRKEQWVRAVRLAERGVTRVLDPVRLQPDTLFREIFAGLARPRPPRRWGLDFGGLDGIARRVVSLAATEAALPVARTPGLVTVAGVRP